jgi:preprotein translocase subunit SecG
MEIVKYILMVLYIIVCLGLIIITMMQNKDSNGASGTIVGSSTNNFYEKNKTRTREGKLKKWTIIFGVLFAVLALALGIVYVM